jgi:hypothetical protein
MANQPRRHPKYEKIVRQLRQRIFGYYEESEAKGQKATLVLEKAIAHIPRTQPTVDQWGATAKDRRMLAAHGMAWGD